MSGEGQSVPERNEMKRMWAVILEIKDNSAVTRSFLTGGIQPDGRYQEGFIAQHQRLKEEHDELRLEFERGKIEAAHVNVKKDDRWWAVRLAAMGATFGGIVVKSLDFAWQAFMNTPTKPGH